MLNQQEFRIGNIIRFNEYFEDDPMLPNEGPLDKDDFIELIEGHLSKAEPIKLNEEWLSKFGFIKEDGLWFNRELSDFYVKLFTLNVEVEVGTVINYLVGQEYSVGGPNQAAEIKHELIWGTPIIYVHQLQNTYFALSGEELKISE